ncbi:DUF1648 domain-containing protein [Bacillus sp. 2205SS5-2]|uniref:DUF1648 domain-containing protein n=1 Tax=Bacillus sp. 2205SS5-2 TaxID=3109031 RepID=UPI003003F34A
MELALLVITIGFLMMIQIAVPFIVKRTVVFGVTVPIEQVKNKQLLGYKKRYALLTFFFSLAALLLFFIWSVGTPQENHLFLAGLYLPFVILFVSLSLYFYFHAKVTKLKQQQEWFKNRKQVNISELNIRSKDEMLPWMFFTIPLLISISLIIFTLVNYNQFPNQIPTHWGPDGKPDAYTTKSYLSILTLPLILLVLQGMFIGVIEMTRKSGINLSAGNVKASRIRQLRLRKYTSWFLFVVSILLTMLFSFLQFTTLYENVVSDLLILLMPLTFSVLLFIGAIILAVKVGKVDSDFDMEIIEDENGEITNVDEDQYWKGGLIYYNRNDPSIFVEKRFGVGWTLNFARPIGYLILFGPLLVILLITFL